MSTIDAYTHNLVDLPTLAERLGVNERHIRRLVQERRIPFIKWGRLLRFDPEEIDDWVSEHRIQPRREPNLPT